MKLLLLKLVTCYKTLNNFNLNEEKLVLDNIDQFKTPPENFRQLSVYPTSSDFENEKPFLRPNISKGAFKNIEHYLDIQFHLLREDFVAPLRKGLQRHKALLDDQCQLQYKKKINNITIYHDVEFEI